MVLLNTTFAVATPGSQSAQEYSILHKTLDEIQKSYGKPVSDESTWDGGIAVFKVNDSLYYSCYFKNNEGKCYQYMVSDKPSINSFPFDEVSAAASAQNLMERAFSNDTGNSDAGSYGIWDLGGRDMIGGLARPDSKGILEEGRVVVTVTVDPDGNVVDTRINNRTNTTNLQLRNAAIEAARKTKFNPIKDKKNQTGTITYYFRLQ